LRVLIVSREYPPSFEGGISRRLERIVPRLLDLGVDIGVVSFGGSSIAGERMYSLKERSKILYTKAGEPSASDLASILNDIWRLDRYASEVSKSRSYDIIHVEEPIFGPFIHSKLPKIVTVHNTQVGEVRALASIMTASRQAKRLIFSGVIGAPLDFLCLQRSTFYVAVSPHVKNQLTEYYQIAPDRITVIPNGIEIPKFKLLDKSISHEKLTYTYVGRLVDHKKVDIFLKGLQILKSRKGDNFKAVIVGRGPNEESLKLLARELSIDDNVKFTGYVDDEMLTDIFEKTDVFVSPSIYEGWGLSIYEAAAYGCAPVVPDIPVFDSYLTQRKNAMLFRACDAEDLAEKMIELDENRELLARIQFSARKVAESFRWEDTVEKLVQLYSRVIPRSKRQPSIQRESLVIEPKPVQVPVKSR
jgi:glycogen synthase